MRSTPQPGPVGLSLNPKPGSDGAMTWKAGSGVVAGVGQGVEDVQDLDDRAGPPVGDEQWLCVTSR